MPLEERRSVPRGRRPRRTRRVHRSRLFAGAPSASLSLP